MLEIIGPDTKSLTAYDTILKLGFTEAFKKYDITADSAIDIAPIIPKYPPLSRMNLITRFFVSLRIIVLKIILLKICFGIYVNFSSIFKIKRIYGED